MKLQLVITEYNDDEARQRQQREKDLVGSLSDALFETITKLGRRRKQMYA